MSADRPTPNGTEHEFGDDELFFSTTDAKGVIELANSTFVRLSHYGVDELVGAPHNIIRHPAMPGGAFAVLWGEVEAGRPACVYVDNLAKDGGTYRVFATAVPLGSGYLSVRMRPRSTALLDTSLSLYATALERETTAREGGASRKEAAELGAAAILEGLKAAGLDDAQALAAAALPAEIAEHHQRTDGLPKRPDATGPYADVLAEMHALDADTAALMPLLDELTGVTGELAAAWPRVAPSVARLDEAARLASQPVDGVTGEPAEDLQYYGEQISSRAEAARTALADVEPRLATVLQTVGSSRLRIALVRLHTLMAATFAAEVVDGRGVGDVDACLTALAQALEDGTGELETSLASLETELGEVAELLRSAVSDVDRLRRPLFRWQSAVADAGRSDLAEAIPTEVEGLAELSGLAARCRQITVHVDGDAVRGHIRAVRTVAVAA